MSKKTFNPADWTETNKTESKATTSNTPVQSNTFSPSPLGEGSGVRSESDIETITQRIESTAVDIAPNYADWRDLGFALADELGESGRSYFHRLSRFYQDYNSTEADKQFDACLKAHGNGVSIKTFYHLAKAAGINVGIPKVKESKPTITLEDKAETGETSENETNTQLCSFPSEIFDQLPDLLRRITIKGTSPEDKDILLLGSLVSMSSCLPNIYGVYAEREVFANLFLFVTAQASAGKGRLTLCRKLVEPIHKALREQNKAEFEIYQRELTEYAAAKGDKVNMEKPQEPTLKMLVIPANNSATGLFQILNDNNGKGLIFETEGDTLAQTFKSEHGNYSDGFRKAFHHETITYNRRKDREFVEIDMPRLSALLSGTPRQVSTLIPNAENGLFSRFIFYFMNIRYEWKDVFAGESGQTLDHYFDHLGDQFHELYKCLQSQDKPMRFCLTVSQQKQFNSYFEQTQIQYIELCGEDYIGTVRRLGLITFRIAMILTALRIMDNGELRSPLVCSDTDFNIAMEMVKVLVQHAAHVFQQLPTDTATKVQPNQKQQFLNMLPAEFDRQTYLAVADKLKIPAKTAEKQIARFAKTGLINHYAQNQYRK
ncbi:hypothetical protein SDC9_38046 [bioreactor metagenome]|uniref:Primase C-terminal 2 domain-containing protein n=1 Tax=bioreactor metagenome TaxID=1076179 RepID=A0A644VKN5_9ZZZZ|nr:DUF3987 domain-containing protein [Paludibacter sp.]